MIEVEATDKQCDMQAELIDLLERFAPDVSDIAALAIAANLVGKILALQDLREHPMPELLETIQSNIAKGHEEAVDEISNGIARALGAGQPRN